MPDIDPYLQPPSACSHSRGLVARPDPYGDGEVLMPDDGFGLCADDGAQPPIGAGTHLPVTLLYELARTNAVGARTGVYDLTIMAIAGSSDGVAGNSTLWIVNPLTGNWDQVAHSGALGTALSGGRDNLYDCATMPEGTATRAVGSGAIDQPVAVFCNGHDAWSNDVQVYPCDAVGGANDNDYEELTSTLGDFKAVTVEAFNGRLYFGNTSESGTIHRQRIRRTPVFNCDPDPALIGSGAMDIREFSRDLLRLEKLGNVLAAYFEDGTAFIRSTDVATSPDAYQVLRERRGLLSTHSVCSVGHQEHFGIFDDGWYILDASGRFTEVGVANIGGQQLPKWKRTFYESLDMDNRNRLFVSYDGNYVRIIYPRVGNALGDADEVWIYDPRSDRVWIENYTDGNGITVFGYGSEEISENLLWSSPVQDFLDRGGNAWSLIFGSWASMGARFGLKTMLHGNLAGYVLIRDPDLITRLNTQSETYEAPEYEFNSVVSSLGEPRLLKTARQIWVEYIQTTGPDMTVRVVGNPLRGDDGTPHTPEQYTLNLTPTNRQAGEILTAKQHFNFTDTQLGFELSGTAPILIRSIETDYLLKLQEERE
jgi:hypothetical protein